MSSPAGLMRPHASHRKSKLLEDMTARVLNASQPKPPEELLALMSEAHRSQIEELAKLVLKASKFSGLNHYDTATSMWPAMSDERRGLIAHVLQKASPRAIDALGEAALGHDRDGLKAEAHLGGVTGMQRF